MSERSFRSFGIFGRAVRGCGAAGCSGEFAGLVRAIGSRPVLSTAAAGCPGGWEVAVAGETLVAVPTAELPSDQGAAVKGAHAVIWTRR